MISITSVCLLIFILQRVSGVHNETNASALTENGEEHYKGKVVFAYVAFAVGGTLMFVGFIYLIVWALTAKDGSDSPEAKSPKSHGIYLDQDIAGRKTAPENVGGGEDMKLDPDTFLPIITVSDVPGSTEHNSTRDTDYRVESEHKTGSGSKVKKDLLQVTAQARRHSAEDHIMKTKRHSLEYGKKRHSLRSQIGEDEQSQYEGVTLLPVDRASIGVERYPPPRRAGRRHSDISAISVSSRRSSLHDELSRRRASNVSISENEDTTTGEGAGKQTPPITVRPYDSGNFRRGSLNVENLHKMESTTDTLRFKDGVHTVASDDVISQTRRSSEESDDSDVLPRKTSWLYDRYGRRYGQKKALCKHKHGHRKFSLEDGHSTDEGYSTIGQSSEGHSTIESHPTKKQSPYMTQRRQTVGSVIVSQLSVPHNTSYDREPIQHTEAEANPGKFQLRSSAKGVTIIQKDRDKADPQSESLSSILESKRLSSQRSGPGISPLNVDIELNKDETETFKRSNFTGKHIEDKTDSRIASVSETYVEDKRSTDNQNRHSEIASSLPVAVTEVDQKTDMPKRFSQKSDRSSNDRGSLIIKDRVSQTSDRISYENSLGNSSLPLQVSNVAGIGTTAALHYQRETDKLKNDTSIPERISSNSGAGEYKSTLTQNSISNSESVDDDETHTPDALAQKRTSHYSATGGNDSSTPKRSSTNSGTGEYDSPSLKRTSTASGVGAYDAPFQKRISNASETDEYDDTHSHNSKTADYDDSLALDSKPQNRSSHNSETLEHNRLISAAAANKRGSYNSGDSYTSFSGAHSDRVSLQQSGSDSLNNRMSSNDPSTNSDTHELHNMEEVSVHASDTFNPSNETDTRDVERHLKSESNRHSNSESIRHSNSDFIRHNSSEYNRHSNSESIRHSNSESIRHSNSESSRQRNSESIRHSNPELIKHSDSDSIRQSNSESNRHSISESKRHSISQSNKDSYSASNRHSLSEEQHSAGEHSAVIMNEENIRPDSPVPDSGDEYEAGNHRDSMQHVDNADLDEKAQSLVNKNQIHESTNTTPPPPPPPPLPPPAPGLPPGGLIILPKKPSYNELTVNENIARKGDLSDVSGSSSPMPFMEELTRRLQKYADPKVDHGTAAINVTKILGDSSPSAEHVVQASTGSMLKAAPAVKDETDSLMLDDNTNSNNDTRDGNNSSLSNESEMSIPVAIESGSESPIPESPLVSEDNSEPGVNEEQPIKSIISPGGNVVKSDKKVMFRERVSEIPGSARSSVSMTESQLEMFESHKPDFYFSGSTDGTISNRRISFPKEKYPENLQSSDSEESDVSEISEQVASSNATTSVPSNNSFAHRPGMKDTFKLFRKKKSKVPPGSDEQLPPIGNNAPTNEASLAAAEEFDYPASEIFKE